MSEENYELNALDYLPEDAVLAEEAALPADDQRITVQPQDHGPEEAIPGMNPDKGKVTENETGK